MAELSKREKEKKEMVMSYEAKLLSETTRLSEETDEREGKAFERDGRPAGSAFKGEGTD